MRILTRRNLQGWASAGVLGTSLGLVLMAPAAATPTTQLRERPATGKERSAPPQMRSLYAMLGKYKCPKRVRPGETPEMGYMTSTKGVRGHFLDTRVHIPGVLDGRGTMGWNPVEGKYFAFYADDWGTSSTATSPGWADGHLVFTGPHVQVSAPDPSGHAEGTPLTLINDYKINRPGRHYTVVQTLIVPNGPTVQNIYDCHRI